MDNLSQQNQNLTEQSPIGTMHHNSFDIMPTASEIGNLWESYFAESMAVTFLKQYVAKSGKPELQPVLQYALDVATQRVQALEDLLNSMNHPIPQVFGEKDVDINIPPLFSETFRVLYTRLMHRYQLISYTKAFTTSYRQDLRNFFANCIRTSAEIFQKATDALLGKGILPKAPGINIPQQLEYVQSKDYFGHFFSRFFGDQRPLNALEIGQIYSIIESEYIFRMLKTGYIQVVKSQKIQDYMQKCKGEIEKHIGKLATVLAKDDIAIPVISEILVTESKQSPFSDKLILSHFTAATAFTITAVGIVMPDISRKDVALIMVGIATDLLRLAKEGAELMIESGWLEKIPESADRKMLLH